MMILFCILYTPLLNFIALKANSVVAAAIMHGSINGPGQGGLYAIAGRQ
jgi:hypothetical protein